MKLFTIPLPNGSGELVGATKKDRHFWNCCCQHMPIDMSIEESGGSSECCPLHNNLPSECQGNECICQIEGNEIGPLSEVTEEIAKEWGFKSTVGSANEIHGQGIVIGCHIGNISSKYRLIKEINKIYPAGYTVDDLSNILLIIIKK
jgi:hypothetical protein